MLIVCKNYNNIVIFNICLQPDDVVNVAIDKINGLLETFFGISDTELGKYSDENIWLSGNIIFGCCEEFVSFAACVHLCQLVLVLSGGSKRHHGVTGLGLTGDRDRWNECMQRMLQVTVTPQTLIYVTYVTNNNCTPDIQGFELVINWFRHNHKYNMNWNVAVYCCCRKFKNSTIKIKIQSGC